MTKQAHSNDRYATPNANAFETATVELQDNAKAKEASVSKARQLFAEANDAYNDASGKTSEAQEIANRAAIELYSLRVTGKASADEATAVLRDIFGAKLKPDGKTPSQTPAGKGEEIRKRLQRLIQAHEYIADPNVDNFFTGLDPADVEPILNGYLSGDGDVTLWTSYEKFAKVKADAKETVQAAFDPKRIAAIVDGLTPASAAEKIWANPALRTAYSALFGALKAIGGTLTELDALASEAADAPAEGGGFETTLTPAPVEPVEVEEVTAAKSKGKAAA